MSHFINIVFDKKEEIDDIAVESVLNGATLPLNEDETTYSAYDTEAGKTVLSIATHFALDEAESNKLAEHIANKFFDLGYDNFNIEISV